MVKNVYLLGAIALLACSLAVASFVNPNSIEGTPQLGVPYEISWEPVISSATSKIKNVRLQLGDGDGITAVNVLFDIATLPFPATTSYTYTWPANLTTTNTNYTVVLQGLDAKDIVLETEYIIWFQLSPAAAPPQIPPQTPPQTPSQSAESQTATGLGTPTQKSAPGRVAATSYGVQDNTLSTGTFVLAVFTIAATVTL